MSDRHSECTPSTLTGVTTTTSTIFAQIVLLPLEEEEDDFETITIIEEIREHIFSTALTLPNYRASMGNSRTRDAGIIILLGEIAQQAITYKDLITATFKAGATAISLLANHRQIKRIEVTLDGDSFIIDEPDKVTAQKLLDSWEAKHPGKPLHSSSLSSIQVTAVLSKSEEKEG